METGPSNTHYADDFIFVVIVNVWRQLYLNMVEG